MAKRNNAAPCGNPDLPIPEGLLYTREQLQHGMQPGFRPMIPAWHLVEGVIKLTYWHAIKYYAPVLTYAEKMRNNCTFEEAKEFIEGYIHFRNKKIEDALKWLLDAYPPFIRGEEGLPQHRKWEMVRNRTSECPQPPIEEQIMIKPYVIPDASTVLKREWLTGIMRGEPGPFFEYLREVRDEAAHGRNEIHDIMQQGGGKTIHRLERIYNYAEMMVNDLNTFIKNYA
jgi:hypothetical protein